MKYIKTYENLLKGKSESRILTELEGKPENEKIATLIKLNRFDLLPRNKDGFCVYNGILDLHNCNLISLPDNLTITYDLDCSFNKLTNLPENLTVGGNIHCYLNQLTNLPDTLTVGGDL